MFKKLLFIFLSLNTIVLAETYQKELRKNMWNLIGVNGYHIPSKNAIPVVGWTQIKDTAEEDNNITWDMIDETTQNSVLTTDIGDKLYSTLGLFIEKESNPDLSTVIINYEKKNKDANKTFLSMFVSSGGYGRKADIKIIFQSDYENESFYLSFNDSTSQSFNGTFSSLNTRENPLFMNKYKVDSTNAIKKIIKTIDMDLSDNNLSNLDNLDVNIDTLNYEDTGGRQRTTSDDNLTVYRWQNNSLGQKWNTYFSNNPSSLNDFDEFEAGNAYWVKLDSNTDKSVGLLLGTGDINATTYVDDVTSRNEGWNLLSFDESYIRYISSGVFIDNSEYNGSGLIIRDSYRNSTVVVPSYLSGSDINVSAYINNTISIGDKNGSFSWSLRAFPALNKNGNNGLILISDENFEVNASTTSYTTMSLDGDTLRAPTITETIAGVSEEQSMYQTRVDEYIIALELNKEIFDSGLSNHQTSFTFNEPSVINGDRKIDLSTASSYQDVLTLVSGGITGSYLIDQNISGKYNTLLLASDDKFYVRDTSIVKIYDFNDSYSSSDFILKYGASSATITGTGALSDIVAQINLISGGTGISSFVINEEKKRIMLMSKDEKSFFIKEKGEQEQFIQIELINESNLSKFGAISDVIYGTELARAKIIEINESELGNNWLIEDSNIIDRSSLTGVPYKTVSARKDLSYTPTWVQDFPIDSPLEKLKDLNGTGARVNYILSGVTREDGTIYWRQADTTMDTNRWKLEEERFNLFKTHEDRGYWVYLDYSASVVANPITINEPIFSNTIVRSFNNYFDGNSSSNTVSEIRNEVTSYMSLTISGTDFIVGEPGENSENVQAHIDGEVVPLIKNGSSLTYLGELSDNEFSSLKEEEEPSLKSAMILVVTDGKGNRKEKTVTFDNVKITPPEYYFEDNNTDSGQGYFGGLKFIVDNNITLRIYDGNLSDYYSNDSLLIKDPETITLPNGFSSTSHHVNPLDGTYISYGTSSKPFYDLRIVGYTDNELWSNMRRVYYAPVYKSTHIIETDESNQSADGNDTLPIAFNSLGQSPAKYTNGGTWTDSGVELAAYDGDYTDSNTTLSMSYSPVVGAKFDSGLATEVYFDDNRSATGFVGRIRYSPLYAGDIFYIFSTDTNTTYYQEFPSSNVTSNDPLELIPIDSNQSFYKPML